MAALLVDYSSSDGEEPASTPAATSRPDPSDPHVRPASTHTVDAASLRTRPPSAPPPSDPLALAASELSSDDSDDGGASRPSGSASPVAPASPRSSAEPPLPLPLEEEDSSPAPKRIRQFAHVDGAYATHVYLPIQASAALRRSLDRHASHLRAVDAGAEVHRVDCADLHVSLSRTVVLHQPQLHAFVEAVRFALRRSRAVHAAPVYGPHTLANDTRTRFFSAMELIPNTAAHAAVCGMVDAVDGVMTRFGHPCFYAERRLHFSYAWSLSDIVGGCPLSTESLSVSCDVAVCRIGERTTLIKLR
ncbi:hypothetical protein AB1Y20_007972 [Prymnesium parvum]|uniref:U6 snRNA phosphodiesterase 1 n=1 Tax=Prymnesium parvum TaxID=97485 RepID=A0AB34ISW7_PRYPA